jgi:hypothetical protein
MTDEYRVLVTELDHGSDQFDELYDRIADDSYWCTRTTVDGLDALDNPVMDWYDAIVVSMDDARSVEYDGDTLEDKHVVLEGVTPLRQPDHIDASYNTADRVDEVMASLRRDEWQQYNGVGDEIAGLLDRKRPEAMDDDQLEDRLTAEYGDLAPMLAARIDLD